MSTSGLGRHYRRRLSLAETMPRFPNGRAADDWVATERRSFEGPVESDETCHGGREGNQRISERRLEGRRVAGKVAVGGILDRPDNEITATVLADMLVRTLHRCVCSGVQSGATSFTDKGTAHRQMPEFRHQSACLPVLASVRAQAHVSGLEPFWFILKSGHMDTCHHRRAKRRGHKEGDFSGRHDSWNADTNGPTEAMASGFPGKRLRYAELIHAGGM